MGKCVRLEQRGSCGTHGNVAFVVNTRKDRPIRVTVRKIQMASLESNRPNEGQWDHTYTIPAGGEVELGCTASGDADFVHEIVSGKVL